MNSDYLEISKFKIFQTNRNKKSIRLEKLPWNSKAKARKIYFQIQMFGLLRHNGMRLPVELGGLTLRQSSRTAHGRGFWDSNGILRSNSNTCPHLCSCVPFHIRLYLRQV